jgi:hypothetical protein
MIVLTTAMHLDRVTRAGRDLKEDTMRDRLTGYYPPTNAEVETLWSDALVVVDTNVLLNFYRYSEVSRREFIGVLDSLKERLWLPHQVALEYHRGRVGVIKAQREAFDHVIESLRATDVSFENAVGKFRKIESLALGGLMGRRKTMTEELVSVVEVAKKSQVRISSNPDEDDVAVWITAAFENRVGAEFTPERSRKIFEDGAKRYAKRTPPGFADAKKPDDESRYGDLILWMQIIDFASAQKKDVIFVTDDEKIDWWRIEHGETHGPRPELVNEFRDKTGRRVQLYKPEQFLREAQDRLEANVSSATYSEVEDISESQSRERYLAERHFQADAIRSRSNPFRDGATKGSINLTRLARNIELQARYAELERDRARLTEAMNAVDDHDDEAAVIDAIVDVQTELAALAEELSADEELGFTADEKLKRLLIAGRKRVAEIMEEPL